MLSSAASRIVSGVEFGEGEGLIRPRVVTDRKEEVRKEILVGNTARPSSGVCSKDLGPMDYRISVCADGKIVIVGGTTSATAAAVDKFVELVNEGSIRSFAGFEYVYRFLDDVEIDSLADPGSDQVQDFLSSWTAESTSPSWGGMDRDLKESMYALTHRYSGEEGRIAVFAHRGDMSHYPENSLPGIIAAIMSGADTVEFDFRYTRDLIPVLFHDENLNRLTNWSEMAGKDGLPESVHISDWTLDELRQLRLLDYDGNVTDFRIATLYEGLLVAGGRIQVSFDDKASSGVSFEDEFIPLAAAAGACSSLIQPVWRKCKSLAPLDGLIDDELMVFALHCANEGGFIGSYAYYADPVLFAAFNYDYLSLEENPATWDQLLESGKRYIGTNRCYDLSLYMRDIGMQAWKY